jgi:hypothetical protein
MDGQRIHRRAGRTFDHQLTEDAGAMALPAASLGPILAAVNGIRQCALCLYK